jgi:hypothetical protein
METLVHQKEWRMDLKQRQDADHKAIMEELAAADFMRQVTESKILEGQNDVEGILVMMRKVCELYTWRFELLNIRD